MFTHLRDMKKIDKKINKNNPDFAHVYAQGIPILLDMGFNDRFLTSFFSKY